MPGCSLCDVLEEVLDDLLFVRAARAVHPLVALFEFVAFVDEERDVAAVVDDELRAFAAGMNDGLPGAVPIFFERLALPGEDRQCRPRRWPRRRGPAWRRCCSDAQRTSAPRSTSVSMSTAVWMVMCSEPVMRTPLSGFSLRILAADGHEAGHFVLGDVDFLAAPVGEGDVADFVVGLAPLAEPLDLREPWRLWRGLVRV